MAPLPDYVAGTITLTNGDTAFTGTGTGWLAASFREGDTILGIEDNPGVTYVIESITDNDAGTLTQPWDGPSGTYEYRMRYLSDGQRVTAQARQLIELLGNGNLAAMAGLDGTPNTLPYFDSGNSMALADFPAWARALFAENGELPDGALPGRLRASSPRLDSPSDDLNDLSESGFFVTAEGVVENRPLGTGEWFVNNIFDELAGVGAVTQIAVRRTTAGGGMAFRHRDTGGNWQDWKIVYHSQNLVGTVSQSGGVPTGAVIESGENANGSYIKLADGTQICTGVVTITPTPNEVSTETATFPAAFSDSPTVVVSTVSNSAAVIRAAALNSQASTTDVTINFIRTNTGATMQNYEAIGRWF